jgi:hypothetical protein
MIAAVRRLVVAGVVFTAAFLGIRIALLLFSADIYYPPEELFMGFTASQALSGFIAPVGAYLYHPHEGGSLVFGLSAAPFFAFFGESYFVLKLAALAWAFASAALWVRFARRYCGGAVAAFTALLWAFAPLTLIRLSLWGTGTQPQCPLMDIAVITAFCSFLGSPGCAAGGARGAKAFRAALWGLISGVAFFFSMLTAISIAACLACWFGDRKRSFRPGFILAFLIGIAAGLGPWLYYNLGHGFHGLDILSGDAGPSIPAASYWQELKLFARMLFVDREWMGGRLAPAAAQFFQGLYATGIVAGIAALFLCRGKETAGPPREGSGADASPPDPIAPVRVYLVLFTCFFIFGQIGRRVIVDGRMMVAYRYFALVYPFLIFAAARAAAGAWRSGRGAWRTLAFGYSAVAAVSCLASIAAEIQAGTAGVGFARPGYSFFEAGWKFAQQPAYWTDPNAGLALSDRIRKPRDRQDYLRGFTEARWWEPVEEDEVAVREASSALGTTPAEGRGTEVCNGLKAVERTVMKAGTRFRPLFYASLGRVLAIRYIMEREREVGYCLEIAACVDPARRPEIVRGIGQVFGSRDASMQYALRSVNLLHVDLRADFRAGIKEGRGLTYYHTDRPH